MHRPVARRPRSALGEALLSPSVPGLIPDATRPRGGTRGGLRAEASGASALPIPLRDAGESYSAQVVREDEEDVIGGSVRYLVFFQIICNHSQYGVYQTLAGK